MITSVTEGNYLFHRAALGKNIISTTAIGLMGKEPENNQDSTPVVSRELIAAALQEVESQGHDVNPYSVARQAGVAPEAVFTNSSLMALIIAAREDQATFTIDSHLAARCQEMEGEMSKIMEINREIYDRALEMEERVIELEAKITDMEEDAEKLTMQLQNSWHLGYKKGLSDGQNQAAAQSQPAQEQPTATKGAVEDQPPPKEEKQSIKSMIDFELPEEEKQSIKARLETERPREEKQSIKSMIDFELPPEEKQSIKSIIDIELSPEDKNSAVAGQTNFSTDDGRITGDTAPIADDQVPTAEDRQIVSPAISPAVPLTVPPAAPAHSQSEITPPAPPQPKSSRSDEPGATPSYNERVFNAVSEGWTPPAMSESYAGLSWREVETIYQYSAGGGASGPNMIFEPLAPGQAAGARPAENPAEKTLPPILKADAPSPKANPSSTLTNVRARKVEIEADPPMERTIGQFLGDTDSYLNLDRVTLEPPTETVSAPAAVQAEIKPSQEETQTLAGAVQALAAQARAEEAANNQSPGAAPPPTQDFANDARWAKREASATYDGLNALASDSTSDVLDLEKLDIFEGLEDIDELRQIEVIEDVIIPAPVENTAKQQKTAENSAAVSSDDLHDLIKSRIKKAEEPHEPPRVDAFLGHPASDKNIDKTADKGSDKSYTLSSGAGAAVGTNSTETNTASAQNVQAGAAPTADGAPGAVPSAKELEALRQQGRNKFVGGKATAGTPISGAPAAGTESPIGASTTAGVSSAGGISPRAVPPEIRKACMILGVRPEDMTLKEVNEKWKSQMAAPGVHPDQGGDTESAIYLNTAKDTLVKWINDQAPKLGKKFGKKDEK